MKSVVRTLAGAASMMGLLWCSPASAASEEFSAAGLTPYVAFAWHTPTRALTHVVGVVWYNTSTEPAAVAAALKELPAGERALLRWQSTELLLGSAADQITGPDRKRYWGPWLPDGSAAEAAFENQFLADVQKDGGSVDYLVLDTEWQISTWTLTQPQLNAIVIDPRWAGLAKAYGVTRLNDLVDNLNNDSRAFALAMQTTTGAYMHDAFDVPLVEHFPGAHCSDFCDGVLSSSIAPQAPDANNCVQPMALPLHGDLQAPVYYGDVGNIRNAGVSASAPLTVLNWMVSNARAYAQGGQPMLPWVGGKTTSSGALTASPFYDELVYHLVLSTGSTNLNLWDADTQNTQADCAAVDADLAKVASKTDSSSTLTPITRAAVPYTGSLLVSGVKCSNGTRVYRVTLPAVTRGNKTVNVVLPGETESTAVTIGNGSCGDWVIH